MKIHFFLFMLLLPFFSIGQNAISEFCGTSWQNAEETHFGKTKKGMKTGTWHGVWDWRSYGDSVISYKGQYKKGNKVGIWTYYHENGILWAEGKYKPKKKTWQMAPCDYCQRFAIGFNNKDLGKRFGEWKFYYFKGGLNATGQYKYGIPDGTWKFYYRDSTLKAIENYKYGSEHGNWKTFHENGNLQMDRTYANGKLEGAWKVTFENGQDWMVGDYINDKKEGVWITYFDNGGIQSVEIFKNDIRVGNYYQYYKNGQLETKTIDSLNTQITYRFYFNGQLIQTPSYENRQGPDTFKFFNEDGSIRSIGNTLKKDSIRKYITYYFDGKIARVSFYASNGKRDSIWRKYYSNGNLKRIEEYDLDKKQAVWKYYTEDGKFEKSVSKTEGEYFKP